MNITWSTEEFEFVKQNLYVMTIKDMAEHLNKTEKSVRRKLEREGLTKGGKKEWTKNDNQLLIENLDKSLSQVLQILKHKNRNTVVKKYYEAKKRTNDNNPQGQISLQV